MGENETDVEREREMAEKEERNDLEPQCLPCDMKWSFKFYVKSIKKAHN